MAVTRRMLLGSMARIGGAGAVYETLAVWDFLRPPPALAAGLELPKDSGKGKSVAILGAGVAGLCAAYELDRAGYDCVVLEASRRIGGRSLTLRRGDSFRELGNEAQVCQFDDGLWLNAEMRTLYAASPGELTVIKAENGNFMVADRIPSDIKGHNVAYDPENKTLFLPGGREGKSAMLLLQPMSPDQTGQENVAAKVK